MSTPIDGLNSTSHISDATATDVATVDEKIVRNTAMPRSRWSASTASAEAEHQTEPAP